MFNKKFKNRNGFTLAEVLVTLTILGVIAAILIPAITKTTPNSQKVMFKKAYNILEQAVDFLINDDILYPNETGQSGFNYATDTTGDSTTNNKFCYHLAQKLDVLGAIACPNTTTATITKFATTAEGIDWYIFPGAATAAGQFPLTGNVYTTRIVVDVNGSKLPNCLSDSNCATIKPVPPDPVHTCGCAAPDTFIIGIRFDGKIRAGMSNPTEDTNKTDQKAIDILTEPLKNPQ